MEKKMGRPVKYTAEFLAEKYDQYKQWINTQSFERPELIKSGERAGEVINVLVKKPQTIQGYCLFAGIESKTFYNNLSGTGNEGSIIDPIIVQTSIRIRESIQNEQISGATVNIYNPNIVARLNGLTDKQEVSATVKTEQVVINIPGLDVDLSK
jgi:hypothetical protein